MENVIEIEKLVKIYENKKETITALNGVDLTIKKGEIFSFLGPNGAGKTTTVRILSCLLRPTSGNATVLGYSVHDNPVLIRENIGVLTEHPGLYERMTVEDNLRFFGSFYKLGREEIDDRMDQLLDDFNLSDRRQSKVGALSKGLKQRAALIKTLIHDPAIVFLDEPTSGLDPKASVELREYIKFLGEKLNKTIFICTHNLPEAQKLSDKVAIIDKGVIKKIGPPSALEKEIFDASTFTFISTKAIPENLPDKIQSSYGLSTDIMNGNLVVYIEIDKEEQIIPNIITDLVKDGIPLLQVTREQHSLEEVYLELIEGDES